MFRKYNKYLKGISWIIESRRPMFSRKKIKWCWDSIEWMIWSPDKSVNKFDNESIVIIEKNRENEIISFRCTKIVVLNPGIFDKFNVINKIISIIAVIKTKRGRLKGNKAPAFNV